MYTSHPGLCAIKSPTGLQWQPGIFLMQLLQVVLDSNGQDLKIIQRANLSLRGIHCFCIVYEKCTINFDPYALVMIIFGFALVKSNMISTIKLIVTNILRTWTSQAQVGPLCEAKILAV